MSEEGQDTGTTPPSFYTTVLTITRDRLNNTLPLLLDETKCAILRSAANGKTFAYFPKNANREQMQVLAKVLRKEGFVVDIPKIMWNKDLEVN